jgi:hypothetical protein
VVYSRPPAIRFQVTIGSNISETTRSNFIDVRSEHLREEGERHSSSFWSWLGLALRRQWRDRLPVNKILAIGA